VIRFRARHVAVDIVVSSLTFVQFYIRSLSGLPITSDALKREGRRKREREEGREVSAPRQKFVVPLLVGDGDNDGYAPLSDKREDSTLWTTPNTLRIGRLNYFKGEW
jgi:hypothetical protein